MNKILTAFLSGIAIGILLAPDKGSATRKKLSDKLDRLREAPLRSKKKEMYQNALNTLGEEIGI